MFEIDFIEPFAILFVVLAFASIFQIITTDEPFRVFTGLIGFMCSLIFIYGKKLPTEIRYRSGKNVKRKQSPL